jgi:ribokinase
MPADIVVIGSLNMDLVVKTPRLPRPGETLVGSDFRVIAGGKGANQAVAAARLGAEVAMVGRVGEDVFGPRLLAGLADHGVNIQHVQQDKEAPTGTAMIIVDETGENAIVIIPGANGMVAPADVDAAQPLLSEARLLILEFEIPVPTVEYAMDVAARRRLKVILNPAPALTVPIALLRKADIVVLNETEAQAMTGTSVVDTASAAAVRRTLQQATAQATVVTVGERGAFLATAEGALHVPAPRVEVVDTTAAGDAFVGGLAVSLLRGASLQAAVHYATRVGALTVTKFGAQTSLPSASDVHAFIASLDTAPAP